MQCENEGFLEFNSHILRQIVLWGITLYEMSYLELKMRNILSGLYLAMRVYQWVLETLYNVDKEIIHNFIPLL